MMSPSVPPRVETWNSWPGFAFGGAAADGAVVAPAAGLVAAAAAGAVVAPVRPAGGAGAQEAEAAGQHHVAVRHREVGLQRRVGEHRPARAGHGAERRRAQLAGPDDRAVAHVLVDLFGGQLAAAEPPQV